MSVRPRALWRLRLQRELPRYLLHALAVFGLVASARFAIAPPRPQIVRAPVDASTQVDRAAEAFAVLFVRRYLTWDSADPEAHRQALAPYLGPQMETDAGLQTPESGSQRVLWTQVVQARPAAGGGGRFTVAAQTDASGLLYLEVAVSREAGGAPALSGYPAFVGEPTPAPAPAPAQLSEVQEPALTAVVQRALRNYLAGAESDLAADLAAGVHLALPAAPLVLESLDGLSWQTQGRSLLALLHARDRAGARYALAYRLAVAAAAGRWEIQAIEVAQQE